MKVRYLILSILIVITFLVVACEREVTRSEHVEEARINGKLYIESDPSGALIYLNNKITGLKTPDTLFWLKDTTHNITLKKFLYRDTSFNLIASINEPANVNIKYSNNPMMLGKISFNTFPDSADVFLNGVHQQGVTPMAVDELIPGSYIVRYEKKGYRAWENTYIVKSNTSTGGTISLEDTTVWVSSHNGNSGFPEGGALQIVFDDNNTAWIATSLSGLVRYDGINWTTWNIDNSDLITNSCTSVAIDSTGKVWVGTTEGVSVFDGTSWFSYTSDNSALPNDYISYLEVDRHNRVWMCTFGGLVILDGSQFSVFTSSNSGIASNHVNFVNLGVDGHVWVGTSKMGVREYNGVNWREIKMVWAASTSGLPPKQQPGKSVSHITRRDANGYIWMAFLPEMSGGAGGLVSIKDQVWNGKYIPIVSRRIGDIYIDAVNRKWLATEGGIVTFINWQSKNTFVMANSGLRSDKVFSVTPDKFGNLWFGTGDGIVKLKVDNLF